MNIVYLVEAVVVVDDLLDGQGDWGDLLGKSGNTYLDTKLNIGQGIFLSTISCK